MNAKKRIAVVGAGLGGLSIAGFLQRAGFPVTVYEQAPAFSRIGAGIILSANAMKAFRRLGIEQNLVETGIGPNQSQRSGPHKGTDVRNTGAAASVAEAEVS
jgi:6-hydroxynicotinate 3-monooxygenase